MRTYDIPGSYSFPSFLSFFFLFSFLLLPSPLKRCNQPLPCCCLFSACTSCACPQLFTLHTRTHAADLYIGCLCMYLSWSSGNRDLVKALGRNAWSGQAGARRAAGGFEDEASADVGVMVRFAWVSLLLLMGY